MKSKARGKVVPLPVKRVPAVSLASGDRSTDRGPSARRQDPITLTAPDGRVCDATLDGSAPMRAPARKRSTARR